jgi:colicin import membrane protein
MPTRTFSAYFMSVLLHGAVVALILFFAYMAHETTADAPKIFELVAGAGDNYAATEAPALGSPDGLKIEAPAEAKSVSFTPPPAMPITTPAITEEPQPAVQEETPPVREAPVPAPTPAKTKVKPKPKTDQVPDFSRTVKRIESKRAARLMAKYHKELEAEERRERLSYEQYQKTHGGRESPEGIAGGVVGGSRGNKTGGAGGKALTREQGELLDAYFALLKSRIKENHLPPPDVSDRLKVWVSFYLAADGSIGRVHVVQSSGSPSFDQSVLEAFARTRSIGPRPDGHGEVVKLEFQMHDDDAP